MKKTLSLLLTALLMLSTVFAVVGCTPSSEPATGKFDYIDYAEVDSENYNKNLYYINELKFEVADPSVIYISDANSSEYGYFYAYGTSDQLACHGIQAWRSKDLTNWEDMGMAFEPDFSESWAANNYWAPEVLYDDGLYYMFYSAMRYAAPYNNRHYMSVAVSDTPYGPFANPDGMTNAEGKELKVSEPVYDFCDNLPNREGIKNHTIDIHAYVDPVTGGKYIYFSAYQDWGKRAYQEIYGCEMSDWFTPKYETTVQLTSIFCTTVCDNKQDMANGDLNFSNSDIDEGQGSYATVNEGAFVYYKDGTYYMTFSVYAYTQTEYQVRQAVSDSPLGPYTKLQPEEGGTVLSTEVAWESIASAGHHSFIECGDQLMIAYHTFLNRLDINNGRALAVDTVKFIETEDGQQVMHSNGPTYSYQPLPEEISGYKNVAPLATVTATNGASGSDKSSLTDGLVKMHWFDSIPEFIASPKGTTITLDFGSKFVNARSIMVYNSYEYDYSFAQIDKIEMQYYTGGKADTAVVTAEDIPFDFAWNTNSSDVMYPGGTAMIEFDELPVNKITLTFNAPIEIAIGEIVVLGKETSSPEAVKEFKTYSYTNPEVGAYVRHYEGETFGSAGNFHTTFGYGNLETDDGTSNAYIENTCPGDQYAYFKGINGTTFYVEAEFTITEKKPYQMISGKDEMFPKLGLVVRNGNAQTFFYIDAAYSGSFTNKAVGIAQRNMANTDYDWTGTESLKQTEISYTDGNYTKLAIARIENKFYFFANDRLMFENDDLRGLGAGSSAIVGCLIFNMGMRIQNYDYTVDAAAVQSKIAQLGVN